jgi:hypothetical protein
VGFYAHPYLDASQLATPIFQQNLTPWINQPVPGKNEKKGGSE